MKAVIYTRVSSEEQVHGYSLDAQLEACRAKAIAEGWTIIDVYSDRGESARTADRPQFKEMLGNLDGVDFLIIHKIDRLARSLPDYGRVVEQLERAGVQLVSVTENIDASAAGKLQAGLMAVIAEWYSNNLSAEIKKGLDQKAKVGGWPTIAPVGYTNERTDTDRKSESRLVIDPVLAPLVTEAFVEYATGEWSITALLNEMNRRGLRNTRGRPTGRSSFHRMLRNPAYVGIVRWNNVENEGQHKPLVSSETFERVQQLLTENSRGFDRSWKYDHYLKGSLVCSCGKRLAYMEKPGRAYFYCLNKCGEPYAKTEKLEFEVEDLYDELSIPKELRLAVEVRLHDEILKREAGRTERVAAVTKRLERLTRERERLLAAYMADALELDLFKQEQKRIRQETLAAERQLEEATASLAEARTIVETALSLLDRIARSYRSAKPETRRKFNSAFFDSIIVTERHVIEYTLNEPFKTLLAQECQTSDELWR